jgi:hypothetical protein
MVPTYCTYLVYGIVKISSTHIVGTSKYSTYLNTVPLRKHYVQYRTYMVWWHFLRWVKNRPGKNWIRCFKLRWSHRVKVRRPMNIKRSRAKVSAKDITDFMARVAPNLIGVPRENIFNYDETPLKDDPAAEDAFFPVGTRHCEKVQNHSKTAISVMFCVR